MALPWNFVNVSVDSCSQCKPCADSQIHRASAHYRNVMDIFWCQSRFEETVWSHSDFCRGGSRMQGQPKCVLFRCAVRYNFCMLLPHEKYFVTWCQGRFDYGAKIRFDFHCWLLSSSWSLLGEMDSLEEPELDLTVFQSLHDSIHIAPHIQRRLIRISWLIKSDFSFGSKYM